MNEFTGKNGGRCFGWGGRLTVKRFLSKVAAVVALVLGFPSGGAQAGTDFEKAWLARNRYWSAIGLPEQDVLAPLISPSFAGGPAWPSTRQAYRVVRRGSSVIIATDGLSDPGGRSNGSDHGLGLELFLETPDIPPELIGTHGDVSRIRESWAFAVLKQAADTVAESGEIIPLLDKYGALSLELPGASSSTAILTQLPPDFITEDDCVGVLIGRPDPDFGTMVDEASPYPIRIVPVVLLTADQLERARRSGAEGRSAITEQMIASGVRHRSVLTRKAEP